MPESTNVRKPQDRKPKAGSVQTVTVRGVELKLSTEVFDDLDLLDAMDQIQEGNGMKIATALRRVAGEQYNEVREALRDKETGRIPLESAAEFFTEALQAVAPNS